MGMLLVGEDVTTLAREVFADRGHEVDNHAFDTFGPLSSRTPGATILPARDWLCDHALVDGRRVMSRAMWRECLSAACAEDRGVLAAASRRPAALSAVYDTLLIFAGEGLSCAALAALGRRADRRGAQDGDVLRALAAAWTRCAARATAAGLIPRTAALEGVSTLDRAPRGVLTEFPGAVAAQTLLRAVRTQPGARLGVLHGGDGPHAGRIGELFLAAAEGEHFELDERDVVPAIVPELGDALVSDPSSPQWDRAARALERGLADVWIGCETTFLMLREAFAGRVSTRSSVNPGTSTARPPGDSGHPRPGGVPGASQYLRWAAAPLDRACAIEWLRAGSVGSLAEERRVLASPSVLSRDALPDPLRLALGERPSGPCSLSMLAAWAGAHAEIPAQMIAEAAALDLRLPVARWATLLLEGPEVCLSDHEDASASGRDEKFAQAARPGERTSLSGGRPGPPVLTTGSWLPSGERPVLWLGDDRLGTPRSLLPRLTRAWLARVGLASFTPLPPLRWHAMTRATVRSHRGAAAVLVAPAEPPAPQPPEWHDAPPERISVSAVVDYAYCPYRAYLRRHFSTDTPAQQTLRPQDLGNIAHHSVERVLRPLVGEPILPARISAVRGSVAAAVRAEAERTRAGHSLAAEDALKLDQLAQRLSTQLAHDLDFLRLRGGRVLGLEWPIELTVGGVVVRGRIDRVDEVPGERGPVLWLWDLKSGRALPKLAEPAGLQLLAYGEALGWARTELVAFVTLAPTQDGLRGRVGGYTTNAALASDDVTLEHDLGRALSGQRQLFASCVEGLAAGRNSPQPRDGRTTCDSCSSRLLCRYRACDLAADSTESTLG